MLVIPIITPKNNTEIIWEQNIFVSLEWLSQESQERETRIKKNFDYESKYFKGFQNLLQIVF